MCRSAKIRPMINGTDRPIAAVWRIWSQNGQIHGQTRKRDAYQLYGGRIKHTTLLYSQLHADM